MEIGVIQKGVFRRMEACPDFKDTYDTVVVGLGTAGTEAALCAAAFGLKTLGVEKQIAMGGQATLGCVYFPAKAPAPSPDPAEVSKRMLLMAWRTTSNRPSVCCMPTAILRCC